MSSPKSAILLLAHGSPESPADIPEFMKHITGGRPVPDAVMKEITHRYSLIGKSPLTEITMRQAEALQASLGLPVFVGMRNWKPFISDTVQQMVGSGINKVVAICLAPQNSSTSVGLYSKALAEERKPRISRAVCGVMARPSAVDPGFCGAAGAGLAAGQRGNGKRAARDLYRAQRTHAHH